MLEIIEYTFEGFINFKKHEHLYITILKAQ